MEFERRINVTFILTTNPSGCVAKLARHINNVVTLRRQVAGVVLGVCARSSGRTDEPAPPVGPRGHSGPSDHRAGPRRNIPPQVLTGTVW
jgi:hypothetical protein